MGRSEELRLAGLVKRGFDTRLLKMGWDDISMDVSKDLAVNKKFSSAVDIFRAYVDKYKEISKQAGGLVVVGQAGCGKSLLVSQLVKGLWDRYSLTSYSFTCDEIFKSINAMWNDTDSFGGVMIAAPVLIVDNLPHTLHQSRSVFPPLETLLRQRVKHGRPTIFVCNVSHEALATFPKSILSLMQETMLFVDMDGVPDYRPKMNKELKKVLGL